MPRRPCLRWPVVPVLAVAVLIGPAAAPAAAEPPLPDASTLVLIGSSVLTVRLITGGFRACFVGSVTPSLYVAGYWSMVTVGVAGTTPVQRVWTTDAWSASHCEDVLRGSNTTGAVTFNVAYTAAGGYLVAGSFGGAAWGPTIGSQPYSVNPTP